MAFVSTYFNRINTESRFGLNVPGWTGNDFLSSGAMHYDDVYAVNGKYKGNKLIIRLLNSLSGQIDDGNNSFLGRITRSGYAVIDINHPRNNPHGRAKHHYEVPYLGNNKGTGFREAIASCTLYKWLVAIHEDTNITKMFNGGVPPAVLLCEGEAAMGALSLLGSDFDYPEDLPKYFRGVVAISPTHGTLDPMDRRRQYSDSVGDAIRLGGLIRKSQVPGYVLIPNTDPDIPKDCVRTLQVFNNDKFVRVLSPKVNASTWPYGNNTWLIDRVKETMMMPPIEKVPRDQPLTQRACFFNIVGKDSTLGTSPVVSLEPNLQIAPGPITMLVNLATAYTLDSKWATLEFEVKESDLRSGYGQNLKVGDIIRGEELMKNMLIPSSNTAAQCLARSMGEIYLKGSDVEYVVKMNEVARSFGVSSSTNFVNSTGIGTGAQLSTARDISQIMLAILTKPAFAGIRTLWNLSNGTLQVHGGPNIRQINVSNTFLDAGQEYITGVKTGTTGTIYNVAMVVSLPGNNKGIYVSMHSVSSEARLNEVRINYQRCFDDMLAEPTKWLSMS